MKLLRLLLEVLECFWVIEVNVDIAFFILSSRMRFTFVIVADFSTFLFILSEVVTLLLLYNILRRPTVSLLVTPITLSISQLILFFLCSAFT